MHTPLRNISPKVRNIWDMKFKFAGIRRSLYFKKLRATSIIQERRINFQESGVALNPLISHMSYGRTGFVGFAGTEAIAAATAALSAARASWRASLVVAAALAASKLLFAVAIFAFAVAMAA